MTQHFIGRKRELGELERCHRSGRFEFVVVRGRRRTGKSALLRAFAKGKRVIYTQGLDAGRRINLANFSAAVLAFEGIGSGADFESFNAALDRAFRLSSSERLALVFDDFPLAAKSDETLAASLEAQIERFRPSSRLMIVLCGSSLEMKALEGRTQLLEKATAEIEIEPLDFFDVLEMFGGAYAPEEAALLYSAAGGLPACAAAACCRKGSLRERLLAEWFDPSGFFFDAPVRFLREEVRSPAVYLDILEAIANGKERLAGIAARIGRPTSHASAALASLEKLGIVVRESPFNVPGARRTRYRIADGLYRFWGAFLAGSASLAAAGQGEAALKQAEPQFDAFMEQAFVAIARQQLRRQLEAGRAPLRFESLGSWWGVNPFSGEPASIDIAAMQDEESALFADCFWQAEPVGEENLERLEEESRRLFRFRKRRLMIFSRAGFTDGCRRAADRLGFANLVSFADMAAPGG